ncbi:MAG TPA: porin [Rudaea sp.]|nr:porin [Rudaea sp.]
MPFPRCSPVAAAIAVSIAPAAHAADDTSLTWNGITLYGVVDIGIAHQTHGTPLSQDWMVGLEYFIQKNSNKSITSVAPNGMSQSRIGLKGVEQIADDLAFVFNLDSGFDPQSGNLADALKSLTHNNGVPLDRQTSAGDSSLAGQLFNRQAYAGLSSPGYGTLTFGRQNSLLLDNILAYDPMSGSYAFSVIGLSGTTAGMGDTEDARLDDSLKYVYKWQNIHAGLLYQFGKTDNSPGEAWQGNLGFEAAGFAVDAVYGHKKDAIAASSLSAAQAAVQPADSLVATVSDNTSYTLDASYAWGAWKACLGYEHIKYENPSLPIAAPITGLGGYYFGIVNDAAFPRPKILQVSWGGLKYLVTPDFDVTGAFYRYDQNSYGLVHCSNASAGTCSGTLEAYSLVGDYRLTKRFDVYAGAMFSRVSDGLASGYLHTSTASPMVGMRFKF